MFDVGEFIVVSAPYLQSAAVPLLGIFGAYIAWQQYQTSRRSLNERLFDRRLKVFDDAHAFLTIFQRELDFSETELDHFTAAYQRSYFLFPSEVPAFLSEIRGKAIEYQTASREYNRIREDETLLMPVSSKMHELQVWFSPQLGSLFERFGVHMNLAR